ncbi:MAG: phasin family protein [Hahellaceae bacterium]|nr:phasin family protein [Hahellaceae bacterium]
MFEKVSEQLQKMGQPMGELFTLGTETVKKVTETNANLIKGLLDDSLDFAREATNSSKPNEFADLQKAYLESVQESVGAAAQSVFGDLSNTQEKAAEFVKSATEQAQSAFTELFSSVTRQG